MKTIFTLVLLLFAFASMGVSAQSECKCIECKCIECKSECKSECKCIECKCIECKCKSEPPKMSVQSNAQPSVQSGGHCLKNRPHIIRKVLRRLFR